MFRLALVRPDQIAFVDLANGVCCATMAKTVLVSLEERNRPVTFSGAKENLLEEIRVVFKQWSDYRSGSALYGRFYLQAEVVR